MMKNGVWQSFMSDKVKKKDLNIRKDIYEKPMVKIIPGEERLKDSPLKINKARM